MNVTLTKIKYSEFASHETSCFEATVRIDGKVAGTVSNDGQGGCNRYHPWDLRDALAHIALTMAGVPNFEPEDWLIGRLLDDHLATKDLQRQMARSMLFIAADGKIHLLNAKGKKFSEWNPAMVEEALRRSQVSRDKVLNLMPLDAAVKTYLAYAQEAA